MASNGAGKGAEMVRGWGAKKRSPADADADADADDDFQCSMCWQSHKGTNG